MEKLDGLESLLRLRASGKSGQGHCNILYIYTGCPEILISTKKKTVKSALENNFNLTHLQVFLQIISKRVNFKSPILGTLAIMKYWIYMWNWCDELFSPICGNESI